MIANSPYGPRLAMDPAGNGLAVWLQSDGVRYNVWANRYTAGVGWGTASLIETNDGSPMNGLPSVAMDAQGNGLAVWTQSDGTRYNIWANRYVAGSGWGTPTLIETDNAGDARTPQVAMDPSGNAVAVWEQSDGVRYNIWANSYSAVDGSWGTATLLETNNGDASGSAITMGHAGNALAVWVQSDGVHYNLWANRYIVGSGWGTATMITANVIGVRIAGDADGNAMAVWMGGTSWPWNVGATSYSVASGWGVGTLVEADTANSVYPEVAMDINGNAIAVWYRDTAKDNRWANLYTAGVGWGTPTPIATNNTNWWCCSVRVAMDINGNAIAMWQQDGIWAIPYTPGSGWGAATLLDTGNFNDPQIAMSANGTAIAAWGQGASGFTPPPPPPACNSWWLHGEHHWHWYGVAGIFIRYFADVSSSTTYGTSAGSCGTPLVVDRLSSAITLYQDPYCATCAIFSAFGEVAFNTSSVSKSDNGWRAGDAATQLCGAQSQHEALKKGIRLFTAYASGCAN